MILQLTYALFITISLPASTILLVFYKSKLKWLSHCEADLFPFVMSQSNDANFE